MNEPRSSMNEFFTANLSLPDPHIEVLDDVFLPLRLLAGTVDGRYTGADRGRRVGVIWRCSHPALKRHSHQRHPAWGRMHWRQRFLPPALEPRQWSGTRPPGPVDGLRTRHAACHPHRARWPQRRAGQPLRWQALKFTHLRCVPQRWQLCDVAGQGASCKLLNKRLFVDAGGPVAFDGMAVEPRGGTAP